MSERLLDVQTVVEAEALLTANLPHSAKIQVNSAAKNAGGGIVPVWSDPPAVPCKLVPFGAPADGERNDQRQGVTAYGVRFEAGTIVTEANRLRVTTPTGTKTLIVTGVRSSEMSVMAFARDATAAER